MKLNVLVTHWLKDRIICHQNAKTLNFTKFFIGLDYLFGVLLGSIPSPEGGNPFSMGVNFLFHGVICLVMGVFFLLQWVLALAGECTLLAEVGRGLWNAECVKI